MRGHPPALLPSSVDLRSFPYMPLHIARIRDSKIAASVTGEEFRAALLLWCSSWHQVPAASLPNDDVELASLAGFGRVIGEWEKVRDGAMHGWVLCSDGRWWHRVVAEYAADVWNKKREADWVKECDRLRKDGKRKGIQQAMPQKPSHISVGSPKDVRRTSARNPPENALNRTENNIPPISPIVSGGQGGAEMPKRQRKMTRPYRNGNGHAITDTSTVGQPEPWEQRIAAFRKSGFWMVHHWGPRPNEPECRAPAELLE